jgi:tetratricopeptide (TPR) repeat protein
VRSQLGFGLVVAAALVGAGLGYLKHHGLKGIGVSRVSSLFAAKDLAYQGTVKHPDASVSLRSSAPPLKYAFNNREYRAALAATDASQYATAEKALRDILARTEDEASAEVALGTVLYLQRRNDESWTVFHKLLEQNPHSSDARVGLGEVDAVLGHCLDAVEEYSLALKENPNFALSYFGRGECNFRLGKRAEAEADMKKTVVLLPESAELAIEARAYLSRIGKDRANTQN